MYNPPIKMFLGGMNLSYVLIVLSLLYVTVHIREWKIYIRMFEKEIALFSLVVLFSVIRSGIEQDYMYIVRHILPVLYIIAVIPGVLMIARRTGVFSEKKLIKSILIVSSVAGCLSMLCILLPSFDEFVRNQLIQYDEEDYLFGNIRRGFGIASGLTSYFGYIQGVIIALCPFYLKDNKWFIFFIPFVFLSILVNARTGVLIALWGLFVYFFSDNKKAALPLSILMIVLFVFLPDIMRLLNFNEQTIAWILDFGNQLEDISSGDFSEGTAATLLGSMNVWPSNAVEWLIGKGILMFHADLVGDTRTDIGWLLQLSYGGIIYIIILYSAFVHMAKRLVKNKQNVLMYFLAGAVFIINTKSKIFPTTGVFTFLMFLYFISILNSKGLLFASRLT